MTIGKISRFAGLAATCALVAVAVSGCVSSSTPSASGSTPPTTSTPSAAASSAPPTSTPSSGCPVDEKTLEAAFHANSSISSAIVLGNGFVDIKCASGFAIARTTPTNVDPARVLFQFDQASSGWKAVTGGTDISCTDHMSADIAAQLGC